MIERHSAEKVYAPAMDFQVMDDTLSADSIRWMTIFNNYVGCG
jgi:hypothetical protein